MFSSKSRLNSQSGNRLGPVFLLLSLVIWIGLLEPSTATAKKYDAKGINKMAADAEKTVAAAYALIWDLKVEHHMADTARDPKHTGMIGLDYSPLTTTLGYENAKELSTKPGWAGWIVRELAVHGIWTGADVAISMSGSFPALNIAVLAALQELEADVQCISSVGASSYGANNIGLSWPEMERILREEGILRKSSTTVTLGGTGDRGAEWSDYQMDLALKAVKRSRLPLIKPTSLRDGIKKRMLFYGDPSSYFCFINVGGGQASVGGGARLRFDRGGWYFDSLPFKGEPNGVMDIFLKNDTPCLNLLFLSDLNRIEGIVKR